MNVELSRVGVIYSGRAPHVFDDVAPEIAPWPLEFIEEGSLQIERPAAREDFLAVFFPARHETDMVPRLAAAFPGAAVIGYRSSAQPDSTGVLARHDEVPLVQFPMTVSMAEHLLETYAALKEDRRDLVAVRQRCDELQEFFEAFVNTVESSWSLNDRRLGMNLLLQKLARRLNTEECLVYLLDTPGGALQRAWGTGNIRDIDLFDYQANSAILERVLRSGEPYVNNRYAFELKVPFSPAGVFLRSVMCVPLQRRGEKAGVIEVLNHQGGGFGEQELSFLQALAGPVAVAARSISMYENAERLTVTDDLTRLYNYRFLMQFLEAEVKRCLRYKKKVSLLFIDVDGFKRINDTFGHLVGSHALAEMGQVFRRILRETDIVGRYGGDEFVIVLPETPLNGALIIAERIRKKVEDYEFTAKNLSIRLTVSLGVANCPKHTLTAEGLIKKADAAMYRAKELSKNSIKVAV